MSTFLVLYGVHTSTRAPVEYVEHIVYGEPKVTAVLVGSRFVAIVEYGDDQRKTAVHTFDRMASFGGIGAQLIIGDVTLALREFGAWVAHYAPKSVGRVEVAS